MTILQLEFIVQMTCADCEKSIKTALNDCQGKNFKPLSFLHCATDRVLFSGIDSVFVDYKSERVIVETSLNSEKVKEIIESTGKLAVLQGLGSGKGESNCVLSFIFVHYLNHVKIILAVPNFA